MSLHTIGNVVAKVVTIGPAEAAHIRATCHFGRQRILGKTNLKRLGLAIRRGQFTQGTPIFLCRYPDGSLVLVNGNHTLQSIADTGISQLLTMIILDVAGEEEAAAVYGNFDIHKTRTWSDALRAVGISDEVAGAHKVMPALGVTLARFKPGPENVEANSSRQLRFSMMEHYRNPAALLQAAITGAPKPNQRVISRAAVFSVALECALYQPTMAAEFWTGLAHDDGLGRTDPRKVLLRWLQNHPVQGGVSSWVEQSRAVSLGWNAYFRGQSIHYVKPNQVGDFVLLGTPWQGKGTYPALLDDLVPEPDPELEPTAPPAPVPNSGLHELLNFGLFAAPTGVAPVTYGKS